MTSLLFALSLLAVAAPSATPRRPGTAPPAAAEPARHDTLFPSSTSALPASTPSAPPPSGLGLEAGPSEGTLLAPPASPGLGTAIPALVVIASLAAIALYLSRRRPGTGRRLVQVLETASLGPRRQLVVVRLGDSVMLLGSSEAGVTLLSMQPAGAGVTQPAPGVPVAALEPLGAPGPGVPGVLVGLWSKLRDRTPAAPRPSFEDLLLESTDDQTLRRKLASGRPARVA